MTQPKATKPVRDGQAIEMNIENFASILDEIKTLRELRGGDGETIRVLRNQIKSYEQVSNDKDNEINFLRQQLQEKQRIESEQIGWIRAHKQIANAAARVKHQPEPYPEVYRQVNDIYSGRPVTDGQSLSPRNLDRNY